jgi:hypothetical protein
MKNLTRKLFILFIILGVFPLPCFSLEKLTPNQLKCITAQSGSDIALNNVSTITHEDAYTFANPDYRDTQFISFEDFMATSSIDTGKSDVNGDGFINHLTIDIGQKQNEVMLIMESPDLYFNTDVTVSNINFCGTSIGSLNATKVLLSSIHCFLGAHANSGIDFEWGFQLSVDNLSYKYNSTDSLSFSNITFANSFTGTDPSDLTTWLQLDGSNLQFTVGCIDDGTPATIDITPETQKTWNFTDSTGTAYSYDNTRYIPAVPDPDNPGSNLEEEKFLSYIVLNLPMKGSIRATEINFGGQNFGPLAIDGINAQKLYIEIPGRGLGKP